MKRCLGKTLAVLVLMFICVPQIQSYADHHQKDAYYLMKSKPTKYSETIDFKSRKYKIWSVEKVAERKDLKQKKWEKITKSFDEKRLTGEDVLWCVTFQKEGKSIQDEMFLTDTAFENRYRPVYETDTEKYFIAPDDQTLFLCITTGSVKDTQNNRVLEVPVKNGSP